MEPLECGCVDPWTCRHWGEGEPSDKDVDAWLDTVRDMYQQRRASGIPAEILRLLYRRRPAARALVERIHTERDRLERVLLERALAERVRPVAEVFA